MAVPPQRPRRPNDPNSQVAFAVEPGEGTGTIHPANFALVGLGTPVDWANVQFDTVDLSLSLGDFNHDGAVNHYDLALWIPHASSSPGDERFDPEYDLNADARVDPADLALLMPRLYQPVLSEAPPGPRPNRRPSLRRPGRSGPQLDGQPRGRRGFGLGGFGSRPAPAEPGRPSGEGVGRGPRVPRRGLLAAWLIHPTGFAPTRRASVARSLDRAAGPPEALPGRLLTFTMARGEDSGCRMPGAYPCKDQLRDRGQSMPHPPIIRREFLERVGLGALGAVAADGLAEATSAAEKPKAPKRWEPISSRKVRFGIVGYGVCQFGAAFGFQDHPNVEIVAVSDLIPRAAQRPDEGLPVRQVVRVAGGAGEGPEDRGGVRGHRRPQPRAALHGGPQPRQARDDAPCRPSSARSKRPSKLLETVQKTGLKYMMAETSFYRADCYAMRQIYRAGGFGRLVYSEGEYYHYLPDADRLLQGLAHRLPPLWYPTHSTAYYVGVTGKRFTSVSCRGFRGGMADVPGPGRTSTTTRSPTKSPCSRPAKAARRG